MTTPTPAPAAPPKPKPKAWSRLLRWAVRGVVVAIGLRLLLGAFLTQLIGLAAPRFGLRVEIRSAALSLSGLSLRLQGVVVADVGRAGAPPLLTAEDVSVDLASGALLHGELVVIDAAIAKARIHLERGADGVVALPDAWTGSEAVVMRDAATAAPAPPLATLRLPFQVRSLRLHEVGLAFVDRAASPPRTDELTVDLAVRDLGVPDAEGSLALRAHSPEALDAGWLRATLRAGDRELVASWQADLRDVRTARIAAAVALPPAVARYAELGAEARGTLRCTLQAPGALDATGALALRLAGDGEERVGVDCDFGPVRMAADARSLPFALRVRAPGVVEQLALTDATLDHRADELSFHGTLAAERVRMAPLQPWLAGQGVTLPADGLGLRAHVDVTVADALSLALRDVELTGGGERIAVRRLAVRDLRNDDEGLAIEALELAAPVGAAARAADGSFTALGVSLAPRATAAAAPAAAPASAGPHWPVVRVGTVHWQGGDLAFTDRARGSDATLRLRDVDLHGDGLAIGVDAPPGRIGVAAVLPGIAARAQLDATVQPQIRGIGVDATLAVDGMTLAGLAPWLQQSAGVPTWRNASLRASANAKVAAEGDGLAIDAQVGYVRLADGDEALLELARAEARNLVVGAVLTPGAWTIDGLDVVVAADAEGRLLTVAGVALPPAAAAAPPAPPSTPPATTAAPGPLPTLSVTNSAVIWRRAGAAERQVLWAATLGAPNATDDATFTATLRSDGAIGELTATGAVALAGPRAQLALTARGLRGDGVATFLPTGVACELADGAIDLAASFAAAPAGGFTAAVTQLAVRDGAAEWLGLDAARLDVAAATADVVHVRELTVDGLRGRVATAADGMRALGLRVATPTTAATTAATASTAAAPTAAGGVRLPRLRIDAARVAVSRWELARADAAPTVLAATATLAPWDASTPERLATPAQLTLEVAAPPLLRRANVTATLAPFALQPQLDAKVEATGVDLTALVPGGTVADASFTAEAEARVNLRRRDPQRFDLGRPIGGELVVTDVVLRDGGDGATLAQATAIEAVARAIDLASGAVLIKSLTAVDPSFEVTRAAEGLRLPGLTIPTPVAKAAPDAAAAIAVVTDGVRVPDEVSAPPVAAREFAIEHLTVQGLRTTLRDETTTPPTVLPVADAEFDVHGFTTRAFVEARPMRFDVSLRGGDVELERRVHAGNLLAGVVGSAARAVTLQGNRHQLERRPLFDEVAVAGTLEFVPFLRGEARASVAAFELMGLRGLAKLGGVEIADGVLDQFVQVDLRGPDGIDVKSMQVFRWLSLTEPPGGPISTYLRLPMPLPTVLFLLRNDAEEQRIPIAIHLPARGVKTSDVVDAFAEAFAKVVADAVASATKRAAGVVTGFFDFLWPTPVLPSARVAFAAGDPMPTDGELAAVAAALAGDPQLEAVLTHEPGGGDLPRAQALANPAREVVAARVAELRARRDALDARRSELVADLDALYAAGRMQEARRGQEALLAHDETLGALERTLDEALAMLANDTPRAARQRAEASGRALGQARLDAVAAALRRAAPGLVPDRVVVRSPRALGTPDGADGGVVGVTVRRRAAR